LCAVPVLLAAHLGRDLPQWRRRDYVALLLIGAVALSACIPQLPVFANVYAQGHAAQVGSPLLAFVVTAMTQIVGNAVFPIAWLPITYALLLVTAVGFWLLARRKSRLEWLVLGALLVGVICMTATGTGIKPRNSVYLLPLTTLVVSSALAALPRLLYPAACTAVAVFQALGAWNVIAHEDTIKGSYNTDFQAALLQLQAWNARCKGLVAFSHDPVMSYMLDRARLPQSSPYQEIAAPTVHVAEGECVAVVKTYRGILPAGSIARMYGAVRQQTHLIDSRDIGQDRYFAIKSRISHEAFPPVYLHLDLLQADRNLLLRDWSTYPSADSAGATASAAGE
jgi:hypothetical protein